MSFSISSVSPSKILSDGGREVIVTGVFEAGYQYNVHIGDLGSLYDPICYSGKPGQGNNVIPTASIEGGILDTLTVYSPRMSPDSSAYNVTVTNISTAETHSLSSVITSLKNQFFTTVYAMKRMQHPSYFLGPKRIEFETPTT